MPTRERLVALGTSRGRRQALQFGDELRHARLAAGLSQAGVAAATGLAQQTISRYERAIPPYPDFVQSAVAARVVGLELSVRCYPAPGQLRDAPHIALIQRLLARLDPRIRHRLEAAIRPGDLRAWDVLLTIGAVRVGVIAETRIRDLQALLRRERLKQAEADVRVDHLLLLVSNTRHNRTALAEAGAALTAAFPLGTRAVLTRLGRGEAPYANGVVIL
jgi:transcriptional regulator with XRE-family HTH domain